MRCSNAILPAIVCLAAFGCRSPFQALGQTTVEDERLQQAVTWMNTVIVTEPIGDIRAYTADQKAALIADLQKWMRGSLQVGPTDAPAGKPKKDVTEGVAFPEEGSLWLLVPQVKADVSEASKWVYGIPYGAPKGTVSTFYPNPDTYLFTGTATFNFAQAFLSISDRQRLCTAVSDANRSSARCKNVPYLMGARTQDSWQRLLSAVILISTTSQNPRFSQGLVPIQGTVSYEKTFSETVTGSFDATKLFKTASDYKMGLSSVSTILNGKQNEVKLPAPCDGKWDTKGCIDAIAYGYGHWQKVAKMLIPTINVKAVTESDLAKSGANTFIQPPTQIPALYEYGATWDLRKYVPSAATRADAIDVMQATATAPPPALGGHAASQAAPSPAKADPDMKWKGQVAWFCIQLVSHPNVVSSDGWWTKFQNAILSPELETTNLSAAQVKFGAASP